MIITGQSMLFHKGTQHDATWKPFNSTKSHYHFSSQLIYHNGGNPSLQTGHCNRYLIAASKHFVWKICRQGVSIYSRLCTILCTLLVPTAPSSSPALTTGTSMPCMQIAQSNVLFPFSLCSAGRVAASASDDKGEGVNPTGRSEASMSSRSTGW